MFEKTIQFTDTLSTYPGFGNIWEGRRVTLPPKQAAKFLSLGYAVAVDAPVTTPTKTVIAKQSPRKKAK